MEFEAFRVIAQIAAAYATHRLFAKQYVALGFSYASPATKWTHPAKAKLA